MTKSNTYRPIMFVGTGSDVGKSVVNAGFCRIFKQDGLSPAPFKAQNMSLNSFPTADGLEIGRAQAVQAEACGIDCRVEMNPVLLKPTGYMDSQIVLNGKPWANKSAKAYFNETDRDFLFNEAMTAFSRLEGEFNPIVVEGAGSISEVNLWEKDITNMRVAVEKDAATYLIADIDKGGVFGSVYGTMLLLPEQERKQVKGILINKFRGDISLFEDGAKKLEELCGVPVVGIIPHFRDIYIDDEDSVVVDKKQFKAVEGNTNIAVVLLRHMSNFTDFNFLEKLPEVNLFYAASPEDIDEADIVLLPGSKNTISDILFLQKQGMATAVKKAHEQGKAVYGICGGFQMMGEWIADPHHVEGKIERVPGLGILPVETILTEEKVTEQCTFTFQNQEEGKGYEIHMGETLAKHESPACVINGAKQDGYYLDERTWGTYIHGIFDNISVVNRILKESGKQVSTQMDFQQFKEEQYDKLAALIRENVDMEYIYKSMEIE
ncbi:cobyric acid synthase [Draconibacterium sp. IB214405]|uniref:cobyric acid synthase n=1 Tax=Draconibacterium sp. IB214405 TaxID=3097352 RepID=UPI002A0AD79D|nr:cobyric acid synthase [Draconibacterium sp. IB214405]MDX8341075.1 cobyric acid synthase [Draconibacterium sp. IB214405]